MKWRAAGCGRLTRFTFGVALAASLFIHARGALSIEAHRWNVEPVNVDEHKYRVWDWRDPQFLRGFLPRPPISSEET